MGMSVGGSRGALSSEPNVVPMIDILLVLLIIFMISQPLSRTTISVQVAPPTPPEQSKAQPDANQIVLELNDDGSYAINQQPVPHDQLDTQLHAFFDPRPAKLLFVKPGLNRKYQDVIEAMDVAKGAGIQIIGFTPKEAYR